MAKRRIIRGPGLKEHANPIPVASQVGNLVCSSLIGGYDPETGELPEDRAAAIAHAFGAVRRIMELSGGTPDDIAKVTVHLRDMDDRDLVNPVWLEMFPDENDRPARYTVVSDLPPGWRIGLEIIALVD